MNSVSRDKLKERSLRRLIKSFKYAIEGIIYAFKYEQNIIVHTLVMSLTIMFGVIVKLSVTEWLVCLILFGLVIATEMINTSIEAVVDLACPKKDPLAKIAKDTASGAVLVFAITASIAGVIIFLPKILDIIKTL